METNNENEEKILLISEDGVEHEFEQVALINLDGGAYAILKSLDDSASEDTVYIFEVDASKEGKTAYRIVEDELLQQRILEEDEALL